MLENLLLKVIGKKNPRVSVFWVKKFYQGNIFVSLKKKNKKKTRQSLNNVELRNRSLCLWKAVAAREQETTPCLADICVYRGILTSVLDQPNRNLGKCPLLLQLWDRPTLGVGSWGKAHRVLPWKSLFFPQNSALCKFTSWSDLVEWG